MPERGRAGDGPEATGRRGGPSTRDPMTGRTSFDYTGLMIETISRMAKTLGGSGVEGVANDARFLVEGHDGSRLRVALETVQQRFISELVDASGTTRVTLDVGPVSNVTEDAKRHPGRLTLHFGSTVILIDSQPTLTVQVIAKPD